MDSSEVGRFGTLRLMKRSEPHKVVASYPIDEEEVTFGRDPSCSIRLYYETVSALHCKIIFRERKAFLVVLGTNGLIVDGCPVFPATGPSGSPVTVPLPNDSAIEINKKCFQFSYPPKELRQTLIDTPSRNDEFTTPDRRRRRRTLRMSMIQSAQVFTPRPSHDPRENLRILKTPIKTPFSAMKSSRRLSSPLKRGAYIQEEDEDDEEDEEDIVLVETNHPKVVEEDRDLVILEHVTVDVPEPEPDHNQRTTQFPIPESAQPQVQQTPRRRVPRASLHRAVLIRSAQRTAMRAEMEKEEEQEADEVEETIQALEVMEDLQEEEEDDDEREHEQDEENKETDVAESQRATPLSGWRKSLGLVTGWALGQTSLPRDVQEEGDEDEEEQLHSPEHEQLAETPDLGHEEDNDMDVEVEEYEEEPSYVAPLPSRSKSPVRPVRPLGKFMTPQASRTRDFNRSPGKSRGRGHVRYSVGGFTPGGIHGASIAPAMTGPTGTTTGARRVRVVEPWKVDDIMVPLKGGEEEQEDVGDVQHDGDMEDVHEYDDVGEMSMRSFVMSPSKRPQVSDEERKAIIERRRSALTAPDAFFGGQMPGSRRLSLFPPPSPLKSPAKSPSASSSSSTLTPLNSDESLPPPARDSSSLAPEEVPRESDEDASILLARMKQMVEGVKRRQSMGPRAPVATATPKKSGFSLLAPDVGNSPAFKKIEVQGSQEDEEDQEEEDISDKENTTHPLNALELHADDEADDEDIEMAALQDEAEPEQEQELEEPQTPHPGDLRHVPTAPTASAATPAFHGMRELFAERAELATPRMDGMRQLFREEKVMATPAFEGVGEMLEMPEGWEEEQVQGEPEPEPVSLPAGKADAPARRITKPAVPVAKGSALRRPMPRATPSTSSTKPTPVAKTGLATVKESAASSFKPVPAAARVARRPHAKVAETEPEPDESAEAERPVRRTTRKTSASPAPEPTPATGTKSVRKPRGAKTPTPQPEEPPSKSSTTRRRAKTPIPEEEDESAPAEDNAAAKVRRSARGKLTIEVKEEDEDNGDALTDKSDGGGVKASAARPLRGRRPAGAATASSIPRGGSRSATRTNSVAAKKVTPASSKDAIPVVGNKENTPEDADEEETQASRKPTSKSVPKPKVTRSVGKTRAASEDVVEKGPVDTARSRVVSRPRARK